MKIKLYDSYSRNMREFEPLEGNRVRIYACGPTVYDYAHIGNLRTYIFEDILRRTLEYFGYDTTHVVNITDVGHLTSDADTGEDKIEQGAKRTGKTAWEIAALYTKAFKRDMEHLNIMQPDTWCRATDHITEQINDIKDIEKKGYAYTTADGVYFDTAKLANYGYLARLDVDGLNAGQRIDVGEKRNATDFALWKLSPKEATRQMEWESPWGTGFPGWHIECSAMAVKYLGETFDIHCGGKDHIPVHHTNEIAQAQVCHGTHLANFWLHGYFLETDQAKMSKSSGEFLRLQTLTERDYDPLSYRYLCLTAHYRSDLKFTWQSLNSAQTALDRLRRSVHDWGEAGTPDSDYLQQFCDNIYHDLNTPKALAVIWNMVKSELNQASKKATLLQCDKVLGLNLQSWQPATLKIPSHIKALMALRNQARKTKNWHEADKLRDQIAAHGYDIEDSVAGTTLKKK